MTDKEIVARSLGVKPQDLRQEQIRAMLGLLVQSGSTSPVRDACARLVDRLDTWQRRKVLVAELRQIASDLEEWFWRHSSTDDSGLRDLNRLFAETVRELLEVQVDIVSS